MLRPTTLIEGLKDFADNKGRSSTPELKDIAELVTPDFAVNWKAIGRYLHIIKGQLEVIKEDSHGTSRCCNEMFQTWLKNDPNATWDKLIEAVEKCCKDPVGPFEDNESGVVSKNDPIELFGINLRKSYQNTRFVFEDPEWPPDQPRAVVNVAIISHKGKKRTQAELIEIVKRHKVGTASIDDLMSPRQKSFETEESTSSTVTKNIADIFSADPTCSNGEPVMPPRRILIEGAPGIGKTVLVKQAAFEWAGGKLLQHIRLLILVFLRDSYVQSIKSPSDLLQQLADHENEMFTEVNRFITQNDGKDVMFLIDGFDEYPAEMRNRSFIYDLICGKRLTLSTVVVTSRPHASICLLNKVDKRVEILGFAEEQRTDYIEKSLENVDAIKLKGFLALNPIINSLCYVPLHLAILLYLFKEDSLPKTLTEMNELFILHTIYHHLKTDLPGSYAKLRDLPDFILNIVINLSEMAYIGLTQNRLVFSDGEVENLCPEVMSVKEAANGYGLLQAIQHRPYKRGAVGAPTSFNFLHSTMQEFLAAFYVSTLTPAKQLNEMNAFWEDHLSFMWMMYVGITGIDSVAFSGFVSNQQLTPHSSKDNRKKGLHLFQCFLEANSSMLPDLIMGLFTNRHIDLHNLSLLPYHVLSLASFLAKSSHRWESVDLENCHMGDTGMAIIKHFLCNSQYKNQTSAIEHINLFGNDLTSLHEFYFNIIKDGYFKKFSMVNKNLNDKFVINLASAVAINTTIESLFLSENSFGVNGAKAIATCLEANSTLEVLDISLNLVGSEGAKVISDALCKNITLKHLNIAHNNILDEGVVAICKCLVNNRTLEELDLSWNSISSKGIHQIALSLHPSQHIVVEEDGKEEQKVNGTLKSLNLSHNGISDQGAQSLSNMLQSNSSLTTLNISRSSIPDNGIMAIVNSVKTNTSLLNLDMSGNIITCLAEIVKLLECNQHLSSLNIQQFSHNNPLLFNMSILNSIQRSGNRTMKWLGLPKSIEERNLSTIVTAINQSRSLQNIDHLDVEYMEN